MTTRPRATWLLVLFERMNADLVLLGIAPAQEGDFTTCAALRATSDVPIIIISLRHDTRDVVLGFDPRADDYVTRPFVNEELLARTRAHLRRGAHESAGNFRIGDLLVAPGESLIRHDNGDVVHLTSTEFRLLTGLASANGWIVSRASLLEDIWAGEPSGDGRLVDVHVRRLRTKIEADPSNPRHLITVRGAGHKLVF